MTPRAASLAVALLLAACTTQTAPAKPVKATPSATPSPTAEPYTPVPGDFLVLPTVLKKQCFGTAGCNVTYRIAPSYVGTEAPDRARTYTVVYDVLGGVERQTNQFTLTGDNINYQSEETIQTASGNAELNIKVTTVLPN